VNGSSIRRIFEKGNLDEGVSIMSIVAEYRRCPKCGRIYSFNPDVGKFACPYCGRSAFQWLSEITKKGKKS